MPAEQVASVVLPRTLKDGTSATLNYRIPPDLRGIVQPGHLVWVPLRNRMLQGVVLDLTEQPTKTTRPTETTGSPRPLRDIAGCPDPEACITPVGLRLAHRVARACVVPLYEVLALLLPPGVSQHAATTWFATPRGLEIELDTLPAYERGILYYLRTHGKTTEPDLRRALSGSEAKLREGCQMLRERGLLEDTIVMRSPAVRPRTERTATLCVAPDEIASALESLKRAAKQHAVVQWLHDQRSEQSVCSSPSPDDGPPLPVSAIYAATGATSSVLHTLHQKGIIQIGTREVRRNPLSAWENDPAAQTEERDVPSLTAGQRRVWEPLAAALDALRSDTPTEAGEREKVFLLHGVTGSGKTEIYLRAAARVMRLGRQALVLVPEIALTAQLIQRFAARFPGQLAVLHSQLSAGERYDEWRRVRRGDAPVVIGSRSAVFAPLPHPGLIVIDEEHEPGFKHEQSPRYHARDVALHLSTVSRCVVILGSATPRVESYHAARSGRFTLLTLPERVGRVRGDDGLPRSQILPLPRVRLVDMRHELHEDNRSIFSRPLHHALTAALERGEQAILFLNRRGAATFVMCRDCGHVLRCPSCEGPVVMHYEYEAAATASEAPSPPAPVLVCHSCTHRRLVPPFCPECFSPRIKSFGIGTQRVEQEVRQMFPQARPLRWDHDSTTGKGSHHRLLNQFLRHEANVLVGTQMIAKGLDLPQVSLVGVIAADMGLYLPDFRSGERTFQLLTQVAGRAGRRSSSRRGEVIIQTYTPEHYALQAAQEHDYRTFYTQEISFRRQTGYPPFGQLVRFVYTNPNQAACEKAAADLAARLRAAAEAHALPDWGMVGPAPAFFQRVRGKWRWHLMLRVSGPPDESEASLRSLLAHLGSLPGWMVDIEPVHVL